jgi:hypothetical protein
MKVEYIKYPKESDADFSYRIRRSSKDLNMRILTPTAKDPNKVLPGVNLRKIETKNGTRHIYETH